MCAASVYPEPGSNSHVYCIYIFKYKSKLIFILVFFKLSFDSLDYFFSFGSTYYYRLVLKGYCLLFNVLFCSQLIGWNVIYFSTTGLICQHIFNFFYLFFCVDFLFFLSQLFCILSSFF